MAIYGILRECCAPIPQRYVVGTTVMLAMFTMFVHRLSFNLSITEMAFRFNVTEEYVSQVCNFTDSEEKKDTKSVAEFSWSENEQAMLLSIFYIGYIVTHLPSGILSDKYGPKNILGFGILVSGVCTLLTPLCARSHVYALIGLRLVMGLSQGPLFPAQSSFVARWSFPNERSRMNSYMNVGTVFGATVGQACTGFLIRSTSSWDVVFYVYGLATFPFLLFWFLFAHNGVASHPFIGEKEGRKLKDALDEELADNVEMQYRKILTSVPVWAMIIAGFGHDWAFFTIITLLPQYMSYVLLFDVEANGLLMCLPYLCMLFVQTITPYVAEYLIARGMSKTTQCKLFFFICNQGAAACFVAATYAKCNRALVVALFSIAMGLVGMIYSCVRVVQVDLAPNMAGFLMALMNGVGAIGGFLTPEVFSLFTKSHTVEGWRNGFIFSAVVITLSTIVFLIWGSSEVQNWNFPTRSIRITEAEMPNVTETKDE